MFSVNLFGIQRLLHIVRVPCLCGALMLFVIGGVWGLLYAPAERVQGDVYRIIYVHVPAAYMGSLGYLLLGVMGAWYLLAKQAVADLIARAIAPMVLTSVVITLITGSIWARPTWGVWWVWDARLTSMVILLLLVLGYMLMRGSHYHNPQTIKLASLVSVVGLLNLPIIKFSVDWWSTLHQGATLMRSDGPSIHESMLWPLMIMILAFSLGGVAVVAFRFETLVLCAKIKRRQRTRPQSSAHLETVMPPQKPAPSPPSTMLNPKPSAVSLPTLGH